MCLCGTVFGYICTYMRVLSPEPTISSHKYKIKFEKVDVFNCTVSSRSFVKAFATQKLTRSTLNA